MDSSQNVAEDLNQYEEGSFVVPDDYEEYEVDYDPDVDFLSIMESRELPATESEEDSYQRNPPPVANDSDYEPSGSASLPKGPRMSTRGMANTEQREEAVRKAEEYYKSLTAKRVEEQSTQLSGDRERQLCRVELMNALHPLDPALSLWRRMDGLRRSDTTQYWELVNNWTLRIARFWLADGFYDILDQREQQATLNVIQHILVTHVNSMEPTESLTNLLDELAELTNVERDTTGEASLNSSPLWIYQRKHGLWQFFKRGENDPVFVSWWNETMNQQPGGSPSGVEDGNTRTDSTNHPG